MKKILISLLMSFFTLGSLYAEGGNGVSGGGNDRAQRFQELGLQFAYQLQDISTEDKQAYGVKVNHSKLIEVIDRIGTDNLKVLTKKSNFLLKNKKGSILATIFAGQIIVRGEEKDAFYHADEDTIYISIDWNITKIRVPFKEYVERAQNMPGETSRFFNALTKNGKTIAGQAIATSGNLTFEQMQEQMRNAERQERERARKEALRIVNERVRVSNRYKLTSRISSMMDADLIEEFGGIEAIVDVLMSKSGREKHFYSLDQTVSCEYARKFSSFMGHYYAGVSLTCYRKTDSGNIEKIVSQSLKIN